MEGCSGTRATTANDTAIGDACNPCLMPVTGMTAPESAAVEESGATEKSKPRSVEAIDRAHGDAERNWRTVYDRPRWRRVIVTRRGCALRFNHIGTGVRAWSSSKRECEYRQCYQYKFFCHVDSPVLSGGLNPAISAKLPKKMTAVPITQRLNEKDNSRRRAAPRNR